MIRPWGYTYRPTLAFYEVGAPYFRSLNSHRGKTFYFTLISFYFFTDIQRDGRSKTAVIS